MLVHFPPDIDAIHMGKWKSGINVDMDSKNYIIHNIELLVKSKQLLLSFLLLCGSIYTVFFEEKSRKIYEKGCSLRQKELPQRRKYEIRNRRLTERRKEHSF